MCRGQPDASEQREQEADLGQASARLMRERQDEVDARATPFLDRMRLSPSDLLSSISPPQSRQLC